MTLPLLVSNVPVLLSDKESFSTANTLFVTKNFLYQHLRKQKRKSFFSASIEIENFLNVVEKKTERWRGRVKKIHQGNWFLEVELCKWGAARWSIERRSQSVCSSRVLSLIFSGSPDAIAKVNLLIKGESLPPFLCMQLAVAFRWLIREPGSFAGPGSEKTNIFKSRRKMDGHSKPIIESTHIRLLTGLWAHKLGKNLTKQSHDRPQQRSRFILLSRNV